MRLSHVPPPDPAYYWKFETGNIISLTEDGTIALRLKKVEQSRALFQMLFNAQFLSDWLILNQPIVALRDANDGKPAITLTLRETDLTTGVAYLQITISPRLGQKPRT